MVYKYVVLFILLRTLISIGATYITNYETTWMKAIDTCTMETPKVTFSGNKRNFLVNYDLTGPDVWVGYFTVAMAFHYRGCMEVGKRTEAAQFAYNNPGLCYSVCMKKGFVGISEKKCYCLNDIGQSNIYHKCDKGCKDHDDIACGGNDKISIYSIESAAPAYTANGVCLLFQTNTDGAKPTWSNCSKDQNVICAFENDTVHDALDTKDQKQYKGWKDSMNTCLELQRQPTSLEQLKNYKSATPSWAGVITSDVIISINDGVNVSTAKMFGYLHEKNGGTVLKFDEQQSNRKILCNKETPISSDTTTTKSSTSATTGLNNNEPSSTERFLTSTRTGTMKASPNIGIPVGVSIAIFIIVVIVVVAIALLKRRGMVPSICSQKSKSKMSEERTLDSTLVNNRAYDMPSDSPYDQIDDVAPQTNTVTTNDYSENNGHYAHTYFVLENTAETQNNSACTKTDVNEDEADMYNKLNSKREHQNNFEGTYDTTDKSAVRIKCQHKEESGAESQNGDMDEDNYNHINGGVMINGKTDNDYGIPHDVMTDYGDVTTANMNKQDVENTYNHINLER